MHGMEMQMRAVLGALRGARNSVYRFQLFEAFLAILWWNALWCRTLLDVGCQHGVSNRAYRAPGSIAWAARARRTASGKRSRNRFSRIAQSVCVVKITRLFFIMGYQHHAFGINSRLLRRVVAGHAAICARLVLLLLRSVIVSHACA